MKIFILTPSKDTIFTKDLLEKLVLSGEVIFATKPEPLLKVKGLVEGKEDRILAVDPDFCNWSISNNVLDKVPHLRAICLQTNSFNWIDSKYAASKGIPVTNLRGGSTEAVAEWAVMIAINLARRIPLVVKDNWGQAYIKHQGLELRGKTAGIIGLGNIGRRIAEICSGMGMNIIYWSRNSKDERFKYRELPDLFTKSDFIFPTLAKNEETAKLISDEMLKDMKKTAIFVSIVFPMYNHKLILERVKKGELFGYGFEEDGGRVFDKYKGNIWAGPALAWVTDGSLRRNAEMWTESIIKAVKGDFETRIN